MQDSTVIYITFKTAVVNAVLILVQELCAKNYKWRIMTIESNTSTSALKHWLVIKSIRKEKE